MTASRDNPFGQSELTDSRTVVGVLLAPCANQADLLRAAQVAGVLLQRDDEWADGLADALLSIARNSAHPTPLRARALLSLGPPLEFAMYSRRKSRGLSKRMTRRIQQALHQLHHAPKEHEDVRLEALKASVWGSEQWHDGAIREAWSSGKPLWKLAALWCMGHVRGFDRQIVEALDGADADLLYEAVVAAGYIESQAVWSRLVALVRNHRTPKKLLLATIKSVAVIGQWRTGDVLDPLLDSPDPEVVEAVHQALVSVGLDDESYEE